MTKKLTVFFFALVAMDILLMAGFAWEWSWVSLMTSWLVTGIVGLFVIAFALYQCEKDAKKSENELYFSDNKMLLNMLLLVAGFLLLVPGLVSDMLGLVFLFPSVRRFTINLLL
jgi:UPF0716 protein FxsA